MESSSWWKSKLTFEHLSDVSNELIAVYRLQAMDLHRGRKTVLLEDFVPNVEECVVKTFARIWEYQFLWTNILSGIENHQNNLVLDIYSCSSPCVVCLDVWSLFFDESCNFLPLKTLKALGVKLQVNFYTSRFKLDGFEENEFALIFSNFIKSARCENFVDFSLKQITVCEEFAEYFNDHGLQADCEKGDRVTKRLLEKIKESIYTENFNAEAEHFMILSNENKMSFRHILDDLFNTCCSVARRFSKFHDICKTAVETRRKTIKKLQEFVKEADTAHFNASIASTTGASANIVAAGLGVGALFLPLLAVPAIAVFAAGTTTSLGAAIGDTVVEKKYFSKYEQELEDDKSEMIVANEELSKLKEECTSLEEAVANCELILSESHSEFLEKRFPRESTSGETAQNPSNDEEKSTLNAQLGARVAGGVLKTAIISGHATVEGIKAARAAKAFGLGAVGKISPFLAIIDVVDIALTWTIFKQSQTAQSIEKAVEDLKQELESSIIPLMKDVCDHCHYCRKNSCL